MGADEVMHMALTFGTLLSSQGAVAHRHGPFGPIGGNPRNSTRFDRAGQPGGPLHGRATERRPANQTPV